MIEPWGSKVRPTGLIGVGFVLLTLTVASGILFTEQIFGQPFKLTHKSLFGILAWLTYGALLAGRWRFGWRGRQALRWILVDTGLGPRPKETPDVGVVQ